MRRLCRMTCAHSGSSARCRIADAEVAGMRGHTAGLARQVRWHTRPRPLRSTPYGLGEGEHTVTLEEVLLIVIGRAGVHTESALTLLAEVVRISVTAIWTSMPMILSFVTLARFPDASASASAGHSSTCGNACVSPLDTSCHLERR